jgi:CHAT domain-containing protein
LRSAHLFHFAGHGYGGEGGGLILGGTAGGTALLQAADIGSLDLSRCLLAVLSGCSTGSGELHGPGDPQSLVRAFLRAGTREVVASYWNLSSVGTRAFMQEFYQAMLNQAPVAESLRQATATLRSGGIYAHPYYWAGLEVFQ